MISRNTLLVLLLALSPCFTLAHVNNQNEQEKESLSSPLVVVDNYNNQEISNLSPLQQAYQECWGANDYQGCVDDVTQNNGRIEIARLWRTDVLPTEAQGHQDLWRQAYYACVQATDTGNMFETCVQDVLRSNNLNATRRYKRTRKGVQHLRGNI